jgi:hypothetical protein
VKSDPPTMQEYKDLNKEEKADVEGLRGGK